jgi:hypothetical protein
MAEANAVLSGSLTVRPLSIATGVEGLVPDASVHTVVPLVSVTVGGVFTAVTLTVLVLA